MKKILEKTIVIYSSFFLVSADTNSKMGRAKKTRQFATMKRMISLSDPRLKEKDRAPPKKKKPEDPNEIKTTEAPQTSSALFFQYNTALGPPFHILLDTSKRIKL